MLYLVVLKDKTRPYIMFYDKIFTLAKDRKNGTSVLNTCIYKETISHKNYKKTNQYKKNLDIFKLRVFLCVLINQSCYKMKLFELQVQIKMKK